MAWFGRALVLLAVTFAVVYSEEEIRYDGYGLLRVYPETHEDISVLRALMSDQQVRSRSDFRRRCIQSHTLPHIFPSEDPPSEGKMQHSQPSRLNATAAKRLEDAINLVFLDFSLTSGWSPALPATLLTSLLAPTRCPLSGAILTACGTSLS